jgi:serine/threonine-protein kinase HipA
MSELQVLLDGRDVGVVRQTRGRLGFTYADSWREAEGAYPLSLSMPLAATEHPHAAIEPFIWGLLPDNEFVLSRWAQKFQVSARNAFALIACVGEDCAGAAQFVSPEKRDAFITTPPAETQWLTETDVANRLRAVKADASAGRTPRDTGQFSLAGAQPKTALLFDGQRWGVPSGRTPTTHILKPPTGDFDGHAENEHLCLKLAQALGLPTAQSEVQNFEDVTALIIERYDRVSIVRVHEDIAAHAALNALRTHTWPSDTPAATELEQKSRSKKWSELEKTFSVHRVHQEDLCQALGVHPARKYQNEGGPAPEKIVSLLHSSITPGSYQNMTGFKSDWDIDIFIDALIFNWLIGGTDAHAKNYSLLLGSGGVVRLAPLYDIASILAYSDIDPRKAKLAMKIGDRYGLTEITLSDWRKLAATCRLDEDQVVPSIKKMATELPDRLSDEVNLMRQSGLTHPIIDRLANILPRRAAEIAAL